MAQNAISITINNMTEIYPEGTTFIEVAKKHQAEEQDAIALVRINGRLRELNKKVKPGKVEFLTVSSKIGFDTYRRSLVMLMMKAIYHQVADNSLIEKVCVNFSIGDDFYCTMQGAVKADEAFLQKVKATMDELRAAAIPFVKKARNSHDACKKFAAYGMLDKAELFRFRRASKVNIYSLNGYEDYYYGYMLPDTSYLTCYDLQLFADGFVLRMPSRSNMNELAEFKPDMKIFETQRSSKEWGRMMGIPTVGALNTYIVNHDVNELMMVQEAYQEKKIADIASQIVADRNKKVVLIAGPSSSGKTTFSHKLATQLSIYGLRPHPIAADDYYVNRDQTPLDEEGNPDYETIDAIDKEQLNKDMLELLAGKTVELPKYNFKTGKREYKGNYKTLGPNDVLIIEGIHGLNDELTYHIPKEYKFKIYISALTQLNIDEHNRIPTTDGRLLRRIARDARTRATSARATIAMWPSVRRGEEKHIFPYQEDADVMFNSALLYELAVLKQYVEPLLFSITPEMPEYDEAKRLLKFLDYFLPIPADYIPVDSLIREFVGGGCFDI